MTLLQIVEIALILFAASVVQGTVGFASGIVAVPLLLITGTTLPEAVTVSAVASFVQNAAGVAALWREIPFHESIRPIAIRLAALPIGILALGYAGTLDQRNVRQIVGLVMLAILLVQRGGTSGIPRPWPPILEWIAFLASGLLLGFCGVGGPPIVMWAASKGWLPMQTRAVLFFIFLSSMIPQVALLLWRFGEAIHDAILIGLAGAPVVLLGTWLGLKIGHRFSPARLRNATFLLLLLMALYESASPWLP